MGLKLLVVEGNTREGRETYRVGFDRTASESYSDTLHALAPDASCDICFPTDPDASLPGALSDYDGVFITGSALNLYDGGPEVERQIELARAVFAARVPFFGSCWGLQVASAAAGGAVIRNPRGREVGVARNIRLTAAGREHPLLAGRPSVYEALCSHLDIVELPPGAVALAENEMAPVQAAEIVHDGGRFWGVQYHPEYSFAEVAAIMERRAGALAREGFGDALGHARELRALDDAPPAGAAWRLGLGDSVMTARARALELTNFIERRVRPEASARGRG
jgi:GMP synthase (glutamine-hydrolysing)